MNWLDVIIAVVLVLATLMGLWQGFIKTLLSLAGIVLGVVVASHFYERFAGILTFISNRSVANIIAFVVLLLAVIAVVAIIAGLLRALLNAVKLGCIDRLAGAVLGLILGALFIGAILAAAVKFFGPGPVKGSLLAGFLLDKFPIVLKLLPGEFSSVRDFFR